jgi:large subunit ribosomal protein L13
VRTYLQKVRHGGVRWTVIDAADQVLGRLAARATRVLTGKSAPDYAPHIDHRDGLIVINAEKIRMTGNKWDDKFYRHHTGYPGGLKEVSARRLFELQPERLVQEAILGMLPKTRLGARIATRLKVYVGSEHPHRAQRPATVSLVR